MHPVVRKLPRRGRMGEGFGTVGAACIRSSSSGRSGVAQSAERRVPPRPAPGEPAPAAGPDPPGWRAAFSVPLAAVEGGAQLALLVEGVDTIELPPASEQARPPAEPPRPAAPPPPAEVPVPT